MRDDGRELLLAVAGYMALSAVLWLVIVVFAVMSAVLAIRLFEWMMAATE